MITIISIYSETSLNEHNSFENRRKVKQHVKYDNAFHAEKILMESYVQCLFKKFMILFYCLKNFNKKQEKNSGLNVSS